MLLPAWLSRDLLFRLCLLCLSHSLVLCKLELSGPNATYQFVLSHRHTNFDEVVSWTKDGQTPIGKLVSPVHLVGELLRVHCTRQQMQLRMPLAVKGASIGNLLESELNGMRVWIGEGDGRGGCDATLNHNITPATWQLEIRYGSCDMQRLRQPGSIVYTASVHVECNFLHHNFVVSCLVPEKGLGQFTGNVTVETKHRQRLPSPPELRGRLQVHPFSEMRMEINLATSKKAQPNVNLFSVPMDCWTVPEGMDADSELKSVFIQDGCPLNVPNRTRFMAALWQADTNPLGYGRRVTTFLKGYRELATFQINSLEETMPFKIVCDVVPCYGFQHHAISELPQCPAIGFCDQQYKDNRPEGRPWQTSRRLRVTTETPLVLWGLADGDHVPFLSAIYGFWMHDRAFFYSCTPKDSLPPGAKCVNGTIESASRLPRPPPEFAEPTTLKTLVIILCSLCLLATIIVIAAQPDFRPLFVSLKQQILWLWKEKKAPEAATAQQFPLIGMGEARNPPPPSSRPFPRLHSRPPV